MSRKIIDTNNINKFFSINLLTIENILKLQKHFNKQGNKMYDKFRYIIYCEILVIYKYYKSMNLMRII